ncbi:PepSY domain-containing protein [Rothia uropygialis]|uniref:PepSY domain-containing protein n=1 Tax=Kocuria sp. 36 TaxID=1415402 RepID=UPI00101DCE00|nr:PepSY domain-containing protein [Kocuria sp. 36]
MRRKIAAGVSVVFALALTGCGADDASDDQGSSSPTSANASASSGSTEDLATKKFPVSWNDALKTAQGKFDGDVSKIELEPNPSGKYEYKIELLSDQQKYAIQIDAESGDTVSEKTDDLDQEDIGTERDSDKIDVSNVMSLEDAMKKAKAVHDGPINKWKLEGKERGPQYEFDIDKSDGSGDNEVQIDAHSGETIPDS